jgi:hypothetical protein
MAGASWFQEIVGIASGILTIAACVFMLGAIVAGVMLAGAAQRARARLASMEGNVAPLLVELRAVVKKVDTVITSLQEEVAAVRETVSAANTGAREVVRTLEDRLQRLDALAEVAQREIEGALVSAVATVRGARAGASVLRELMNADNGRSDGSDDDGPEGSDALDTPERAETLDSGELDDGNEWRRRTHGSGGRTPARPRRRGR